MESKLWIGLAFAVGTALATNLAFLWKHRGAVAAPGIDMRRPLRSATELFRSKWWTLGWAVAVLGWTFHVGAGLVLNHTRKAPHEMREEDPPFVWGDVDARTGVEL